MKSRFYITALLLLTGFALFTACTEDTMEPVKTLDVTYYNLDGTWQLAEWSGNSLDADTYCYITFNRRDRTFVMYQNFDSMYARCITGTFYLDTDYYLGDIISGSYDYDNGSWNHDYIITDLSESGSMVWTATDDPDDWSIYVRCE